MIARAKFIGAIRAIDHHLQTSRDSNTFTQTLNNLEFSWINRDNVPLPPERRSWGVAAYISFWAVNNLCLSNWQVGSSLVARGNSLAIVMSATAVARLIIALVAVMNGWIGSEYHIGYATASRCTWGVNGYYIALFQRVALGIIWMGIQSWIGGLCVSVMLSAVFPQFHNMKGTIHDSASTDIKHFVGFVVYCVITALVVWVKPEKTTRLFVWCNVSNFVTLLGLTAWALAEANRGVIYTNPITFNHSKSNRSYSNNRDGWFWSFAECISATIGSIAVGLTTQPDYNRFSKSIKAPIYGQVSSILLFGTIIPLFGCLTTKATEKSFGHPIWLPPVIAQTLLKVDYTTKVRVGTFFLALGLVVCQLCVNTLDNTFSVGMDLSGMFPRYINLRRGSYLSLAVTILMRPWLLVSSGSNFIRVMSGYAVFMGPVTGIMICDYWLVRRRKIRLSHLYMNSRTSIYWFTYGVNWRALISWLFPLGLMLPGFIGSVNRDIKMPHWLLRLQTLAYVYGLCMSFACYYLLNLFYPPDGLKEMDLYDIFGTFTPDEARIIGIREAPKLSLPTEKNE